MKARREWGTLRDRPSNASDFFPRGKLIAIRADPAILESERTGRTSIDARATDTKPRARRPFITCAVMGRGWGGEEEGGINGRRFRLSPKRVRNPTAITRERGLFEQNK